MNKISKNLLLSVADLHEIPAGAVSFRENGESKVLNSTANIIITKKTDKIGIDVEIKKNTKNESLHIPVVITEGGINEVVYNNFEIGDNCKILIVAGCGVHTNGKESSHNGIHSFKLGKNCNVKYVERHIGTGNGTKILSPTTNIFLGENSVFEMQTIQISGVSFAERKTVANLEKNSKFLVKEKVLTESEQVASSKFLVNLNGKNSRCEIISRVVAKNSSKQTFESEIAGNNECYGRVECDGIVLDNSKISSVPSIKAMHKDAELSHEAQIGKIAGEQIIKLMSLGLGQSKAEQEIINGFLR